MEPSHTAETGTSNAALPPYETLLRQAEAEAKNLASRSDRIGNLRGLAFLGFVAGSIATIAGESALFAWLGLLALGAFFALVFLHGRLSEVEKRVLRRAYVLRRGAQRTSGRASELVEDGAALSPGDHPFAADLDLFGKGSLYQRLSIAHTRMGEKALARMLTEPLSKRDGATPFDPGDCRQRQRAVAELAEALDFRLDFETESLALTQARRGGELVSAPSPDPEPLLAFLEGTEGISSIPFLRPIALLIPVATLGLAIAAQFARISPFAWVLPWIFGIILLARTGETTSRTFLVVSAAQGAFLRYADLLTLVERFRAKSELLRETQSKLVTDGKQASELLGKLREIQGYFELRNAGLVYPIVNSLLLWDIHATLALESFRRPIRDRARGWFEVLGTWEALTSLATFGAEEPSSRFPEFVSHGVGFSAKSLGHPLLPRTRRVENDVAPFRAGHGLLVTGSNMSGKSTFLRSIGTNLVLAHAGAPVVAAEFRVPPCVLGTSLRIADSLQSGVSHFYAEVKKLASIVAAHSPELPVFFLLDEVLHGTNSRERTIGARWVLTELLAQGALGVVTTHDEHLARLDEQLLPRLRQHHFRESVENDAMAFDYTLRDGPVQSGNALRLMRLVGLDVPLE